MKFSYPDEPDYGTTEHVRISNDGLMLEDADVKEKSQLADGSLRIVTEERGKMTESRQPSGKSFSWEKTNCPSPKWSGSITEPIFSGEMCTNGNDPEPLNSEICIPRPIH